jgi:hypothetical protein
VNKQSASTLHFLLVGLRNACNPIDATCLCQFFLQNYLSFARRQYPAIIAPAHPRRARFTGRTSSIHAPSAQGAISLFLARRLGLPGSYAAPVSGFFTKRLCSIRILLAHQQQHLVFPGILKSGTLNALYFSEDKNSVEYCFYLNNEDKIFFNNATPVAKQGRKALELSNTS